MPHRRAGEPLLYNELRAAYEPQVAGEFDHRVSPEYMLFMEGRRVDEQLGPAVYRFDGPASELRVFDFVPTFGIPMPVFSKRALDVLTGLPGDDFQPYPAVFYTQDGLVEGYFAANILRLVSCIDHSRSDYDMFEVDPTAIGRFRNSIDQARLSAGLWDRQGK